MSRQRLTKYLLLAWAAFFGCAVAARVRAQTPPSDEEKNWEAVCKQAKAQPFTPPRLTGPLSETQLQKCDSADLYYGFHGKADAAAALQCAYYERTHPSGDGDDFKGPGVLTMLYANGKGVSRNYNLAIRFACEANSMEEETALRIGHLEHLRDTGATSAFDLCDDIMTTVMMNSCASIREGVAKTKRRPELETLSRNWSPQVKAAFQSLEKAEKEFEDARSGYENGVTGGSAATFVGEGMRTDLGDQFFDDLKRFAKGDIPAASEADLEAVDARLNAVYRKLMAVPESHWEDRAADPPSGIRKTERAWLKLRDAWIAFGRLAYPGLDSTRIAAELTRVRLKQLEEETHVP